MLAQWSEIVSNDQLFDSRAAGYNLRSSEGGKGKQIKAGRIMRGVTQVKTSASKKAEGR
jgi:hypothetical protein